jgi:allantoin racemase
VSSDDLPFAAVPRPIRIAVVNCNTTTVMTEAIAAAARTGVPDDVEIVPMTPAWGVSSAEGYLDSFISAAAVLDLLSSLPSGIDGVVMAGFGEHGREGARQLLDVPVVDITEVAAMAACLLGARFGVVTTADATVDPIRQSLRTIGLHERCVGVRAAHIPVLDLADGLDSTRTALAGAAERLLEASADVLVLGCAGMSHLAAEVRELTGAPVVDGVVVGAAFCADLVRGDLRTSKLGPYRSPDRTKSRPGWPAAAAMYAAPVESGRFEPMLFETSELSA